MKIKRLIGLCVFSIATIPAFSQFLPISLEIRGGINRSEPYVKEADIKERFSYRTEAILDLKKGLGFFTRTGVILTEKNVKLSDETPNTYRIKADYLEFPAMLGYKLSIPFIGSINGAGGLYFGYGIGGKTEYKESKVNTFNNYYKKFDTGFSLSAGIEIKHITLNIGYENGFLNVAKKDSGIKKLKNRSVYAVLGFKIL